MMMHTMFLSALLVLTVLTGALAQQQQSPLSPAMQAFSAKDYARYLYGVQTELANAAQKSQTQFDRVTATAVALTKTNGWDGASGTAVCGDRAVPLHCGGAPVGRRLFRGVLYVLGHAQRAGSLVTVQ